MKAILERNIEDSRPYFTFRFIIENREDAENLEKLRRQIQSGGIEKICLDDGYFLGDFRLVLKF